MKWFALAALSSDRTESMGRLYFDVVAIASSAGGVHALGAVLLGLPADFSVPLVVVQHLDPTHPSLLADVLARRTKLRVKQAKDGDRLMPGTVLLAPPNRHLLINADGTASLTQSKLVHFVRPSADLLFESVAASYGERAVAVVLTGSGSDGAMGIRAIKKMGGTVIVQDPKTAEFSGMPDAAVLTEQVDFIVELDAVAALLCALAAGEHVNG
jgi:two-component system, chemotaxis family, protein-glutamate methylesterase/glutaminase